jgi:hypothetical protein
LGGMATALRLAQEAAGISLQAKPQLVYFPKPQGIFATLLEHLWGQRTVFPSLPKPLQEVVARLSAMTESGPLLTIPVLLHLR